MVVMGSVPLSRGEISSVSRTVTFGPEYSDTQSSTTYPAYLSFLPSSSRLCRPTSASSCSSSRLLLVELFRDPSVTARSPSCFVCRHPVFRSSSPGLPVRLCIG